MRLTEEDIKKLKQFDVIINGHSAYETIEALQQEYQKLDAGHSKLFKDFCKAREVLKQTKETLQFYGDSKNYFGVGDVPERVGMDCGSKANKALAKIVEVMGE
jgi:hypothetical protein